MKNTKKKKCINCKKRISRNALRCVICHNKNRIISDEHRKNTSLSAKNNPNYGMKGKKHSKETIKIIKEKRAKQIIPKKDTSIELKIQNFLRQLEIEFFTHQYMNIKHGYLCDILIPSMDLVIECDGDYWHKYPIGLKKDHIRTKELIEKGFKVLRLWERDIKKMTILDVHKTLEEFKAKKGSKTAVHNLSN